MKTAGKHTEAGFTLIEIMVALAILGTGLLVLLDAHYAALRLFNDTREEVVTQNLMERALGQAEAEAMAGKQTGNGDFGSGFPGYAYSYNADVMDKGQNTVPLITVTVSLTGPNDSRTMNFLVYNLR